MKISWNGAPSWNSRAPRRSAKKSQLYSHGCMATCTRMTRTKSRSHWTLLPLAFIPHEYHVNVEALRFKRKVSVFSVAALQFFSLEDMQNQTLVLKLALERWNSKWLQSERHLNLQRRSVETCGAYSHVPGWHAQIEKSVALPFHLLTWTPCSVEFRETPFGTKQIAAFLSESLQSWDDTHISEV